MKSPSATTLSVTLFLFTAYTNAAYIYFFASCGQSLVTSNLVAMFQLALAAASIGLAFKWPRLFWYSCIAYFLSFPVEIFLLSKWFPDIIVVEELAGGVESIPAQNLGVPILLLILSLITYLGIYRRERGV